MVAKKIFKNKACLIQAIEILPKEKKTALKDFMELYLKKFIFIFKFQIN